MLSKEDILKVKDFKLTEVEVPEWGGSVYMRSFSGKERCELELEVTNNNGNLMVDSTFRAKMVRKCLCDEEGVLLFDESEIEQLNDKSSAALERLFNLALKVSGFSEGDVEEMEKNSESNPN